MPKVRNNYFNYLAMVKDKDTGVISNKKMYKTIEEIITDYQDEYSVTNIKNRCHRTKHGIVKNGLLIYSVRVPLNNPSMLVKYKHLYESDPLLRTCIRCECRKPAEEISLSDGLCKPCIDEIDKLFEEYEANH